MSKILGKITFNTVRLADGRLLEVHVDGIVCNESMTWLRFLEHVYDRRLRQQTNQLIATRDSYLFVSDDLGSNWKPVPVPIDDPKTQDIWSCFTTDEGNHLVVIRDTAKQKMRNGRPEAVAKSICVYDPSWKLIKEVGSPGYIWHGNYSIDQHGETIMYGEYPIDSPNGLAIRRSRDGGLTWEERLRIPTSAQKGDFPEQDVIRHIHTCQADPWKPGRWYVSNGDALEREICSLWISEDDGDTWKRSEHRIVNLPDFPVESHDILHRAALRMTPPIIGKDFIHAVTDDAFGYYPEGSSRRSWLGSLHIAISKEPPHEITVLDNVGHLAMRSSTRIDDDYYLCISECTRTFRHLNVYVFNLDGWSRLVGHLPLNASGLNSGPGGASSFQTKDGTFFTAGRNVVFDNMKAASCVMRWSVSVSADDKTASTSLPPKTKRKQQLMHPTVFYANPEFTGCPLCGGTQFEEYGKKENRLCSQCRSLERQRTFARIYENFLRYEFDFSDMPLLHFAPTPSEIYMFSKLPEIRRVTTDALESYKPDLVMDICDMRRIPDDSFGSAIAASVLEFVYDEEAALSELHRILCDGGRFFFAPAVMRYGVPTRILDVPATHNYGDTAFKEHKVAYYREYGDVDLIALLQKFFVVKTFQAYDHPTKTLQTWYCGIKSKDWKPERPPRSTADVKQVDITEILKNQTVLPKPLSILSVECSREGTVAAGKPVTWTCQATGQGDLEYAWYFFRNDERIETSWYGPENFHTFSPTEPGIYKIQVYVQSGEEKKSMFSPELIVT